MTSESFGIGFVGAGFITQECHVDSVEYIRDAHVAGILNPTVSKAEQLAAECQDDGLGDPAVYGKDDVAALVENPDVDGLWVTNPNHTRMDVIEAAVEAVENGANLAGIAMEKPVARDLAETDRIVTLIERAGLNHAYLENWPHQPDIKKLATLLWSQGRSAGRPYIARSKAEHSGPHSAWFWDGRKQGGGVLTDMLCHSLSGNDFLLSDPQTTSSDIMPITVTADAKTLKWGQPAYAEQLRETHGVDYEQNPADDYARATVTYETDDGREIISEATGSWCYVGSGVSRRIELLGPEYSGQVVSDESQKSVFFSDAVSEGDGWAEKQTATSGRMPIAAGKAVEGGYVAENRDAIGAFQNGENGLLDVHHGRDMMELCMAAYKSAETGTRVDLRETDLTEYTPPPARD